MAATAMADDTEVEKLLTTANNQFAAKMFHTVSSGDNAGKSVVMSGFSAMSPLAQLGLASAGESHDEILKAIGLPNDDTTKDVFSYVGEILRAVKGVDLKIANRVFIPDDVELNDEYAAVSRDVFRSDVKLVNFSKNQEAAVTINTWVEDNTNKRIKDLVDPKSLSSDTKVVLVNAIYFKGSWVEKFDPKLTQDRDFHVNPTKTVKLPTMHKNGHFKLGSSQELDAKLLELFYEGGEASLLIVLPNKIDGINELKTKLQKANVLEEAIQNMSTSEVDVYLPKFKIETTTNLKEVLQRIGVTSLFDPAHAKLEKLLKGSATLHVSNAIQKAFIEVNEKGAEASAASGVMALIVGGHPMPTEIIMHIPFLFMLKYRGIELFRGQIVRPCEAKEIKKLGVAFKNLKKY